MTKQDVSRQSQREYCKRSIFRKQEQSPNSRSDGSSRWQRPGGSQQSGITDDGRSNSTEEKESTLFKFFLEYVFAPSKAIFHSKIWLKSKFRYTDKRKKYFNITFKELKFFYFIRKLKEIWKYHLQCDPLKLFLSVNLCLWTILIS